MDGPGMPFHPKPISSVMLVIHSQMVSVLVILVINYLEYHPGESG